MAEGRGVRARYILTHSVGSLTSSVFALLLRTPGYRGDGEKGLLCAMESHRDDTVPTKYI